MSTDNLPLWHGWTQEWWSQVSGFLHGWPHDHSRAPHRRVLGDWTPQWHATRTVWGHGGQGPGQVTSDMSTKQVKMYTSFKSVSGEVIQYSRPIQFKKNINSKYMVKIMFLEKNVLEFQ